MNASSPTEKYIDDYNHVDYQVEAIMQIFQPWQSSPLGCVIFKSK